MRWELSTVGDCILPTVTNTENNQSGECACHSCGSRGLTFGSDSPSAPCRSHPSPPVLYAGEELRAWVVSHGGTYDDDDV